MSRSLRRGALAATAIVFSIASLSACGAGNDAQTLGVKPDNAATSVDSLKVQNATVITQPKLEAEGPAVVSATLFNDGTESQTLDSITLPGTNLEVKLSPAKGSAGPITVPAQGSVVIGGAGNASAEIENGREASKGGDVQEVVFRFSETGDVKLDAFVVPASGYFAAYGPSALPTPPAQKPSVTPSGTPSGSPSGSPSGAANAEAGTPGNGQSGAAGTPSDAASASHDAGADAGH
ncbi:DUF461 domain-containing protein [Streptomyces sp. NBC_01142]|uniref:DUF461 domain-containing protein n=1 Tax=Streptomyces sp. NBC_01142 TaxID=2975865 RepID=UPI002256CDB2|nr:DUF461 domain-containing protein [Streptomyces sp. NBC_01142]MCX4824028.1 DUF461 domain-containing protein [Streptomyces sp. NBC_01142]